MNYLTDVLLATLWVAIALTAFGMLLRSILRIFAKFSATTEQAVKKVRFSFPTAFATMLAASVIVGLNTVPRALNRRDLYGWPFTFMTSIRGSNLQMPGNGPELSCNILIGVMLVGLAGFVTERLTRRE